MELDVSIQSIRARALEIPLKTSFEIASGGQSIARVLYVTLRLSDGTEGYGEAAPFEAVTGETLGRTGQCIRDLTPELLDQPVLQWESLAQKMRASHPNQPAARCALETAMLDALCRSMQIPMSAYLGDQETRRLYTDITIPILPVEESIQWARTWVDRDFRVLKLKIGRDWQADLRTIEALVKAYPKVKCVLDANGGYSQADAEMLIEKLKAHGKKILALEQPLATEAGEAMASLRGRGVTIAADESARSLTALELLIESKAVEMVNLKIMKSGVFETIRMAERAKQAGLKLMIGGMVETRLAMGCSLAIARGLGGFSILDLDTPLFMNADAWRGGYEYRGAGLIGPEGDGLDGRPGKLREL